MEINFKRKICEKRIRLEINFVRNAWAEKDAEIALVSLGLFEQFRPI